VRRRTAFHPYTIGGANPRFFMGIVEPVRNLVDAMLTAVPADSLPIF
jgi:hypothetical protein